MSTIQSIFKIWSKISSRWSQIDPLRYRAFQKKNTNYCLANFLETGSVHFSPAQPLKNPRKTVFYPRIKIGKAIDKNVLRIPYLKRWVLKSQPIRWCTFVFIVSQLPRHLKRGFILISSARLVKNPKIIRFVFLD